ncbi:sensor histidine kinase [Streptomyces sp. SP18CS02]|uniref:sensor histidine kinase n=1 Tax=Streptomyces sp. SP18CS02 TaxID=3002531 RepID=UPI002E78A3BD|nr:histidine kinase [Streptomyces sp. SP18CS02]MEE1757098.1 histidine kinase [Streptomyces sp. SP18CS02]
MRRERLRHHLCDLALWAFLSVPVLLRSDPNDGGSWPRVGAGVALLGVCAALCRSRPLVPLALVAAASLATSPELFTASYVLALAAFGYLAGRRSEHTRPALWLFGAVAAAGLLVTLAGGSRLWVWFSLVITLALTVVAPWLAGRYVRQYAQLVRTGWELAERMEREQRAAADRARLRERSRIAGDMHDSLGHDLALIAVRAAALQVAGSADPAQRAAADELRRAAAEATARLRDIIGVLRAGEDAAPTAPAGETVRQVVDRARASGMAVELTDETGDADGPLPPMTDRAVHRVVQEALTNAAKHAPGAPVTARVVREAGTLTATVTNAPCPAGPRPAPVSGGTGLVGLDERVRLAGGTLTHGPAEDGGFTVTASLPVGAAGAAPAPAPPPALSPLSPLSPLSAEAPTASRELSRATRRVRRGLAQAILIPLALLTGLVVLMAGFGYWTQTHSAMDRATYDRIRVGDARADVETRLPPHSLDGPPRTAPAEPPGMDECLYYRTGEFTVLPVYRLCFRDGRLADRAVVAGPGSSPTTSPAPPPPV